MTVLEWHDSEGHIKLYSHISRVNEVSNALKIHDCNKFADNTEYTLLSIVKLFGHLRHLTMMSQC